MTREGIESDGSIGDIVMDDGDGRREMDNG
jgi:hypothetical protein